MSNPIRKAINLADALSFPRTCQICSINWAHKENGFVCRACCRNTQKICPPWCAKCGFPLKESIDLKDTCNQCSDIGRSFSKARSLFIAQGIHKEVIHRFKHHHQRFFEPLISIWLSQANKLDINTQPSTIIPVTLHHTKKENVALTKQRLLHQLYHE